MNKIFINHGTFKLGEYELKRGTLSIGRGTNNDIQIDDPSVSNHHAKIVTLFETAFIEDLKSTNGTFVNGKPIQKHTLRSSDIISLGKHQILYHSAPQQEAEGGEDHTMILDTGKNSVSPKQHAPLPRGSAVSKTATAASLSTNTVARENISVAKSPAPKKVTPLSNPDVDLSSYRQSRQPGFTASQSTKQATNHRTTSAVALDRLSQESSQTAVADVARPMDQFQATSLFTPAQNQAQAQNRASARESNQNVNQTLNHSPNQKHLEQNEAQLRAKQLWDEREKSAPLDKDAILKQIIYKDNEFSANLLSANWFRLLAGAALALLVLTFVIAFK